MACQGLIAQIVPALENTINIQSVLVPHVKVRKHIGLSGGLGEVQRARN